MTPAANGSSHRARTPLSPAAPQVFAPTSSQDSVFEEISELVQSALDGHKVRARALGSFGAGQAPRSFTDARLYASPRAGRPPMLPRLERTMAAGLHLCLRPDGQRQDLHHAGQRGQPRHHPARDPADLRQQPAARGAGLELHHAGGRSRGFGLGQAAINRAAIAPQTRACIAAATHACAQDTHTFYPNASTICRRLE